jgi:NifU-like protein involved in Fe-S cluster formation
VSDYSESFLDHYRRPRNLGDLEDSDVVAILHERSCGDMLRLALRIRTGATGDAVIDAARFKAYGCAAIIAVGSVLTEMVIGVSIARARELSEAELVDALGGLPAGRMHAAMLGREVLRAAIGRVIDSDPGDGHEKTGATQP